MIEIKNLTKYYANNKVLNRTNLNVEDGVIFGLIGESGSGKSTILRCINGLEDFQDGQILINGVDIKTLSSQNLRGLKKEIGMVFQDFSLIEQINVYENIALPMKCWKFSKTEIKNKINELIELVGLKEKLYEYPKSLSGGQMQRIAIARALTLNPSILLFDEATSALDRETARSILDLIIRLNKERHITIIMVSHQMEVIQYACNQIGVMQNGKVQVLGDTSNLIINESINSIKGEVFKNEEVVSIAIINENHDFDNLWVSLNEKSIFNISLIKRNIEYYQGKKIDYFIFSYNKNDINNIEFFLYDKTELKRIS